MPVAQSLRSKGHTNVEAPVLSMTDLPEHQRRLESTVSDSRNFCNRYVLTCNYSHLQMTAVDQRAEQLTAQSISKQLTQPHFRDDAPSSSSLAIEGKRQV